MLFSQWLRAWLDMRASNLAPRTRESYENTLRLHVLPVLGSVQLDQLQPAQIIGLLARICAEGHSRTAQIVHAVLHRALADAVQSRILASSPIEGISRPAHRPRRPQWLEPDQIGAYVAAISADKYRLAWLLALCCGLRRGEICGLQWQDFDFQRGIIHVRRQKQRLQGGKLVDLPPKSAAGERNIPISPQLVHIFRTARQLGGPVVRLTPSALDRAHARLLARAGLPHIRLHDIRHTMGAVAIRQQVPIKVLQALLGHAHYSTTADIYAHVDDTAAREAVARITHAVL